MRLSLAPSPSLHALSNALIPASRLPVFTVKTAATKQRLAGVTGLLDQLRRQDAAPESSATLIPHVLPCLRDHNSKIALGALEILELLVARVSEHTSRSYFKLLWISLVERLGDSKVQVREKAVDVVVQISVALDVSTVLEKLKLCMRHKNWRTREQVQRQREGCIGW